MTDAELIGALKDALYGMMDWMENLSAEFLEGDPETYARYRDELRNARNLLRENSE